MASEACCKAGPPVLFSGHTDKGKTITIDDLPCYVSGDAATAKTGILLMYDIFGFDHPQQREIADRFAAAGYYVVMPDVFRGDPWTLAKFPPTTPELKAEFGQFIERINTAAPADVNAVKAHFSAAGLKGKYGVAGFCWGGKWATVSASDPAFGAAVSAHPAMIDNDLVSKAQCNIAYFPANGDVDCEPFIATLQGKGFSHSYTKRYEDQIHGFCAARGDWNKPDVMAAAEEVIAASIAFFNQCLEAK